MLLNFQCYRRILQLDPTNIQGLHNLCVVMVERGKLTLAAQCLERAAKLAPHQDYVQRHLAIVRARINRLPPEERDTEIFDDTMWSAIIREPTSFDNNDPSTGQFLAKTDPVFLNHAVVHNHMGNKANTADPLNNHIIHLKGPPKSPRTLHDALSETNKNALPEDEETSSAVDESNARVERTYDNVISGDVSEIEINRNHAAKLANSD